MLKKLLKKLLLFLKFTKSKEQDKLLLKSLKLFKLKKSFLNLSLSINILKESFKKSLKYQSLSNKLNKSLDRAKRSLKSKTNMKLSNKLKELYKKLLSCKNSKKSLEILITLKKFFKLSTDMNKPQFKLLLIKKNLLRFHTFLKKLSKRLSLCHKSLKSWNTSMKSLKNKLSVLQLELMSPHMNKDINYWLKILKLILELFLLKWKRLDFQTQPLHSKLKLSKSSWLSLNNLFYSQELSKFQKKELLKKLLKEIILLEFPPKMKDQSKCNWHYHCWLKN